jgi:hypothetical protein
MCLQFYVYWELCGCITFGRIAHCSEIGLPFYRRHFCEGPFRVLNYGIVETIPSERVERKVGMCSACSKQLYQEMWALRWDWTSRQSEEWAAQEK